MVMNNDSQIYYTHFEITGGLCNLIGSNWCDLFTNRTIFKSNQSSCKKMKDKEYRMANFATFVSKTLTFSPPKMDEFNFKPAQYCINKIFEVTKSCIWAISKWM